MKRIYLLRHGKSDWNAGEDSDHERPLANRGIRDSKAIGRLMASNGWLPERILCSSAKRTRQTLDLLSKAAQWENEAIDYSEDLYLAAPDVVLETLQQVNDSAHSAMIVGHQPFTSIVASHLLGGLRLDVPTACLIVIDSKADSWSNVAKSSATLVDHIIPRSLA